jgi:putative oxidoreductase
MKAHLNNERDLAALALRLGFGFFMVFGHGLPKLQMLFSGNIMFLGLFGLSPTVSLVLAVMSEFLAALLVLIGLKTRLASIPVILTMVLAAFYVHLSDPLFMANASGGSKEVALLFLFGFLGTFLLGSGKYSLDAIISKK